jgi:Histone-like transcription factor (CBF/NF-Y) and archaeal histone
LELSKFCLLQLFVGGEISASVNCEICPKMSQNSPSKTPTSQKDKESAKEKDVKLYQLPLARIRTIMKSCPDASGISSDALFMVCKSTELFLQYFAQKAYQSKGKTLDYKVRGT